MPTILGHAAPPPLSGATWSPVLPSVALDGACHASDLPTGTDAATLSLHGADEDTLAQTMAAPQLGAILLGVLSMRSQMQQQNMTQQQILETVRHSGDRVAASHGEEQMRSLPEDKQRALSGKVDQESERRLEEGADAMDASVDARERSLGKENAQAAVSRRAQPCGAAHTPVHGADLLRGLRLSEGNDII